MLPLPHSQEKSWLLHSRLFLYAQANASGYLYAQNALFAKCFPALAPGDLLTNEITLATCFSEASKHPGIPAEADIILEGRKETVKMECIFCTATEEQDAFYECIGSLHALPAETSLREKELVRRYDALVDEITEGFYELDPQWNFIRINRQAELLMRISKKQLLHKSLWDIFPEKTPFAFPSALRTAMAEKVSVTFDDYRPDIDRYFHFAAFPSAEGLKVFFKDNTAEHKVAEALHQTEAKLQALLDSSNEGYFMLSPEGIIISYNNVLAADFERYFRLPVAIGINILSHSDETTGPMFQAYLNEGMAGRNCAFEFSLLYPDAEKLWYHARSFPVYDKNQQLIGIAVNYDDITERKKAELAISGMNNMLKAIYESTTEASSFLDRDFIIRYNNRSARINTLRYFGREANPGDNALEFVVPELQETHLEYYRQAMAGQVIQAEEFYKGTWWKFLIYPVRNDDGKIIGLAHNMQDLTAIKKEVAINEAQRQNLRTIAHQHSHEIRRPLANILSLVYLMQHDPQELLQTQYRSALEKSATELDSVIRMIVKSASNEPTGM